MRAERVAEPLRIDGRLDEAVYARVPPMSDFIQNEPDEGSPANEKTDVWILFDDEHFYIVGRCWETEPARLVANEMRRDNFGIVRNDNFAWSIDTFFDRRNGFLFEVNPLGGRLDGQITNETQVNSDWNPIWEVRVNGHPNLNDPEQILDRNILGSGIGHRQTRASPDERARSRRPGRQPREAGAERSEAP